MGFSDKLRELRTEKGLTSTKVAAAVGVSQRTVDGWESGLSQPSSPNLKLLIKFFGDKGLELLG